MNHLTAAHGELHVRSGCDSPWRGVRGEHGDRRIGVSFCADTAKRTVALHVAADADGAPRRGGRQTHTRPTALVPRPAAAPKRNAAQPDGVRLTSPCARRQVRHEAVGRGACCRRPWTSRTPTSTSSCGLGASTSAAQCPPRCGLRLQPRLYMRRRSGFVACRRRSDGRPTQLPPRSPACAARVRLGS